MQYRSNQRILLFFWPPFFNLRLVWKINNILNMFIALDCNLYSFIETNNKWGLILESEK